MFDVQGPHLSCANPRALVVLFHGYGSDGENLITLAKTFQLPDVFFWCPHGYSPCESNPRGRQWFSLAQWDSSHFEGSIARLVPDMNRVAERCSAQLKQVLKGFQGPLFVGGFSQGAALAYHIGLFGLPVAGVIGFSGFTHLTSQPRFRPPLFWSHGADDEIVPFSWMEQGETSLKGYGLSLTSHVDQGSGHHITPESIQAARSFLKTHLQES